MSLPFNMKGLGSSNFPQVRNFWLSFVREVQQHKHVPHMCRINVWKFQGEEGLCASADSLQPTEKKQGKLFIIPASRQPIVVCFCTSCSLPLHSPLESSRWSSRHNSARMPLSSPPPPLTLPPGTWKALRHDILAPRTSWFLDVIPSETLHHHAAPLSKKLSALTKP